MKRSSSSIADRKGRKRLAKHRARRSQVEKLERRDLLATAVWHNPVFGLDVTGDQPAWVSAMDALNVINDLNRYGPRQLPRQSESRSGPPFIDSNCDGYLNAMDALLVINHLGRYGPGQVGGFSTEGGYYSSAVCSPQIVEGAGFVTEYERILKVPANRNSLVVTFEAPSFDTSTVGEIKDALEVWLQDKNNKPINNGLSSNRRAVLNWTEGFEPIVGPGSRLERSASSQELAFHIDVSEFAAGTEMQLVMRLINNDRDDQTSVILRGFEFRTAAVESPSWISAFSEKPSTPAAESIDLEALTDVTGLVSVDYGRTSLSADGKDLVSQLRLKNSSAIAVLSPMIAVFDRFSSSDVQLLRPDGVLADGRPFKIVMNDAQEVMAPQGELLLGPEFLVRNGTSNRFNYGVKFYAGLHTQPPAFVSQPLTSIEAGKTYRYSAQARSESKGLLTYSLIRGPVGMSVEGNSGVLVWPTNANDIGLQHVVLRASDQYGLYIDQPFTIDVRADLANRPPIFVSEPKLEATAAGAFEVVTLPTGGTPSGIAAGYFGPFTGNTANEPLSLVTINQGSQTISLLPTMGRNGAGKEIYGELESLNVGEPPLEDDLFRTSLNVDVGLPAFRNPSVETNRILGVTQGDFNADGNLDVVSSIVYFQRLDNGYDNSPRFLTISLGNGDGTFQKAVAYNIPGPASYSSNDFGLLSLRAADFDRDGLLDVLGADTHGKKLLLYRGRGDGTFEVARSQSTGTDIGGFQVHDVNKDGKLDLVAIRLDIRAFGVMLGNGDGTFQNYVGFTTHSGYTTNASYAVADLNKDNKLDFVSANHERRELNIYFGNGDGTFTAGPNLGTRGIFSTHPSTTDSPMAIVVADFTGDGSQDIAYTTYVNSGFGTGYGGGIALYAGDGSGINYSWSNAVSIAMTVAPSNSYGNAEAIDLNSDGHLDMVFSGPGAWGNNSNGVNVALNRGDGTFTHTFWVDSNLGSDPRYFNVMAALGVWVGDFNNDGLTDLLTARPGRAYNSQFASVSLMLADAPGAYRSAYDVRLRSAAWGTVQFVETADFNNDGILDLWGPIYQNASATQLGQGDGTFQAPITATPYIGNESLGKGFVADLDRDGNMDVVWYGGGGVQGGPQGRYLAALGNGDGTFRITYAQTGSGAASGVAPRVIKKGDFDGDGYIDFASITGQSTIEIMRGVPETPGTFARVYSVAINPDALSQSLEVGDFDGDSKLDVLAVMRRNNRVHDLRFYKGVGNGTLLEPTSTQLAPDTSSFIIPNLMTSGDLNGDGHLDVVITAGYNRSAVLLGNGDGSFATPTVYVTFSISSSEGGLHLVDINGDQQLDLVSLNDAVSNQQVIEARLGNGDGSFGDARMYGTSEAIGWIVFGDFDNDGRTDLGVNGRSQQEAFNIFLAQREGLSGITVADLNGDGPIDILAINHDNSHVKRLIGDGRGNFTRTNDLVVGPGPVELLTGDFDQNGKLDFLTINRSGRNVSVMLADGNGRYSRTDVKVGRLPVAGVLGKVTGGNFDDLLVVDAQLNALILLVQDGTGRFTQSASIPLGDKPSDIAIGKVEAADGSRQYDVVITLAESKRLMILRSLGNGQFASPTYVSMDQTPGKVAAGDLNGDGHYDLAVTFPEQGTLGLFFAIGNGRFTQPQRIRVGVRPDSVAMADVNGDGLLDILVTNAGDDTASIILNRFDPNQLYRYESQAVDPDDDRVSYALLEGPGGMILDGVSGSVRWAPTSDQLGLQRVVIEANDGQGGRSTQEFTIFVDALRTNKRPVMTSAIPDSISADSVFQHVLSASDSDGDPLRYRLVNGPEGATIDATTGAIFWDPRNIALESSRQYDRGWAEVPHTASQNVESVTMEGWFKIASTNWQAPIAKANYSYGPTYFGLRYVSGYLQVMIGDGTNAGQESLYYQYPARDEWVHIAGTFDATSGQLRILVNGAVVASMSTTKRIGAASSTATIYLGSDVYPLHGDMFGVRLWSKARTPEEIKAGMHQEFPANTPNLFADYRFDEGDALSIMDRSGNGNNGLLKGSVLPKRIKGMSPVQTEWFTVSVEDGRGGNDIQTFSVSIVPKLTGQIEGKLFADTNGDGAQQPGELGLSSWILYIDRNQNGFADADDLRSVTNTNGTYRFDGLLEGSYSVQVESQAGFVTESLTPIVVRSQQKSQVDLPVKTLPLGQLRGKVIQSESLNPLAYQQVFADLNGNGVFDEAEPTTTTDTQGNYALGGLTPGRYSLHVKTQSGWKVLSPASSMHDVLLAQEELLEDLDFVVKPQTEMAALMPLIVTKPKRTGAVGEVYRYVVTAKSRDANPIQYSLPLSPDGMVIDKRTGEIVWKPNGKQTGHHQVIVRASTDSSHIDLQEFILDVEAANSNPVITSSPPSNAYVGKRWIYAVAAQDAEQTDLRYSLITSPAGVTMDSLTGVIQWTPSDTQVGNQDFTIEVQDSRGGSALHSFVVKVDSTAPMPVPFEIFAPRSNASVLSRYRSRAYGVDAAGQKLFTELLQGPQGLTLDSNGFVEWNPSKTQLGTRNVRVRFTSHSGVSEEHEFAIDVRQTTENSRPAIMSAPKTFNVVVGQVFVYDMVVRNNDNDALSFELITAPTGMSIDSRLGTIRWLPTSDQLGQATVTIRVSDSQGADDTQSFNLTTRRLGGPPQIHSIPGTEAAVGSGYLYTVKADDAEIDPLVFSLIEAPQGMIIDARTGEISWTPTSNDVGLKFVSIAVADASGNRATQSFGIDVKAGVPNRSPVVLSQPILFATVGASYSTSILATDPEGSRITYSLRRGPEGMQVDSNSGVVQWTPTENQAGRFVVTLVAADDSGGAAIQSFEIDVLASNRAPIFVSTAPTFAWAGGVFQYDAIARDADRDPIRYQFTTEVPNGMTMDVFGRIRWQSSSTDIGTYSIEILAQDTRGGRATQQVRFEVRADSVPPKVTVLPNGGGWPWDGPIVVLVSSVDNVGVVDTELRVNGTLVPLDANRTARLHYEDWGPGVLNLVAKARDAAGNETTGQGTAFYRDPEVDHESGEGLPIATIRTPSEDGTVFGIVDILGTALGGTAVSSGFKEYRLSYARQDQLQFTEFVHSTTPVNDGLLGVWDTSLLENDAYILRLEVRTESGNTSVYETEVGLSGNLKLGNFRLSFEDLTVPVAGIPITVVRTYDTLRADREGDFGHGWRMEYRNTDLRVSLPKSGLEDLGIFTPFRSGTKIYMTLPGGERLGWTFTPEFKVLPGFGLDSNLVLASPRYSPDRGNTATLTAGSGWLTVSELGELYATGGIPWNPASPDFGGGFTVTTPDGIEYFVDGLTGEMRTAKDRNNNILYFSEQGIESSVGGVGIRITRDSQGRVSSIADPAGSMIRYRYSAEGNLIQHTDRDGNNTRYIYRDDKAHYLDSVLDPLGRRGVRADYGTDGRLNRLTNAEGNSLATEYNLQTRVVTTVDVLARTRTMEYDDFGNILKSTSPTGAVTRYRYDDYGKLAAVQDAMGNITQTIFDWRGNLLSSTDALGRTTRYQYDAQGNPLAVVDALGAVFKMEYDRSGSNTKVSDAVGRNVRYRYDANGKAIAYLDSLDQQVTMEYDAAGRVSKTIDPAGSVNRFEYDAVGNLITTNGGNVAFQFTAGGKPKSVAVNGRETDILVDAAGKVLGTKNADGDQSQLTYNPLDLLTEVTLSDGRKMGSASYDAAGRRTTTSDPNGRVTRYEYDAEDRIILTEYSDGSREEFEYDLLGNRTKVVDRRGAVTRYEYSPTGKLTRSIDPLGHSTTFVYDAVDQLIRTIDPDGNVTSNEYDLSGMLVAIVDGSSRRTEYRYDAVGRLSEVIDAAGRSHRYQYDLSGRLAATVDGSGAVTRYLQSEFGIVEETDANGNTTRTTYDSLGRPIRTDYPGGGFEQRAYDNLGLLTSTNNGAKSVSYQYDDFGNVSRVATSDNEVETFSYTFDGLLESGTNHLGTTRVEYHPLTRLPIKVTEPDGKYVRYEYDVTGNRTVVATGRENHGVESITTYQYDLKGQLVRIIDPNGGETVFEYSPAGRLILTRLPNQTKTRYSYDRAGRITGIEHLTADSSSIASWLYEYDGSGNRIAEYAHDGSVAKFEYDRSNRLISEIRLDRNGNTLGSAGYRYDSVGNLIARTGTLLGIANFTYNASNQLIAGDGLVYTYDAGGNLSTVSSESGVTEYSFDARGRLRHVNLPGGNRLTYEYDFDGRQVSREDSQGKIEYWIDRFTPNRLHQVLRESMASDDLRIFVGANNSTTVLDDDGATYFHRDAIGSIRVWTDESGAIRTTQNYSGYGEELSPGNSWGSNAYLGERKDSATGLVDLRARIYNPETGRFLSRDPLPGDPRYTPSMNTYLYAHGNPTTLTDPSGMMTLSELQTTLQVKMTQFSNSTYRFAQTYQRLNESLGIAATRAGGLMIASALNEPQLFLRAGITFFGSAFLKGNLNLLLIGVDMLGGKQLDFKKLPYPPELYRPVNGVVPVAWFLRSESTKNKAKFALMPGFLCASEGLAAEPRPFIPTSTFGVPSMAGIMVHEMSHATLDTKDHAYNTQSLLISDGSFFYTPNPNQTVKTPTQALENADSYRAVAEAVTVGQLGAIRRKFFT